MAQIEELNHGGAGIFGELSLSSLFQHSGTIRRLYLFEVSGEPIQKILESRPHLECIAADDVKASQIVAGKQEFDVFISLDPERERAKQLSWVIFERLWDLTQFNTLSFRLPRSPK